ncbi:MAG: nucleoside-diphosphate kinase [bacterium TMED161]|nr:nucleoside-diphosphate kinase [Candidatus Neomarinimicrobiota bacterium]OUW20999.1 MAG: nucleoside-diphosphate kinase [bacterium TMED161]
METTLAIVKPDAYKNGYSGKIIDRIIKEGFAIDQMKQILMTKEKAEGFYEVHKERPFFGELVDFMSSGNCVVLSLKRENAVAKWREVIGATNPEEADEGTIRALYGTNTGNNAVHGSDSAENGIIESNYFFKE